MPETTALPRRGAHRAALSREDGIGLPELLVSIVLLAILMTIAVSVFSAFTNSFSISQAASDSTNVASLGMNEVTRVVRSGTEIEVYNSPTNLPVFVLAKKEQATLYAYLDADVTTLAPIMVQFTVDPTSRDLVEKRWAATKVNSKWTFPNPTTTTPVSSRVIARKIVAPSGGEASFFTYLKTEGCPTTQPTCSIVPASGDALSGTEIASIVAVEITMKVQADPTGSAAPVTITNRVGIPNLGKSRVGL